MHPVTPKLFESDGASIASTNLIASAGQAAELLTVLGNEKRLVIMTYLVEQELSVGTIAKLVSLSQSALSQHLAKLRACGLVQTRRDRQTIYYSSRCEAVRDILNVLKSIYGEVSADHAAEAPPRAM